MSPPLTPTPPPRSINCADWVVTEGALTRQSVVSVPLYDTLGPQAVEYICNHAELVAVACSVVVLPTLLASLPSCPTVKLVVVFGAIPPSTRRLPGVTLLSLDAVRAEGRAQPQPPSPPRSGDVATICYTSGTTGNPKGVVLTHLNLISNTAAMEEGLNQVVGDVHLSYLPLAHIYERVVLYTCLHNGTSIGFFRGDVLGLLDDMAALRPTIFVSVPRLLNRIHDKILAGVAEGGALKRALFKRAFDAKAAAMAQGRPVSAFWDKLVFSKLREKLGGRVRLISSGSAPIAPEVLQFLRVCFGGVVFEGYGMTESACVISKSTEDDLTAGHVGPPTSSCEIKLFDVPDMGYLSSDQPLPRGEICVRGPSIFSGYFKDPVETAAALDAQGWLHTGDIGTWLPGGRLKIIDRKKDLVKLAQGEYVALAKVENCMKQSPLVEQALCYAVGLHAHVVGLVVPQPEALRAWAAAHGLPESSTSWEALCAHPAAVKAVLASVQAACKGKLAGFETPQAIGLVADAWSVANDCLTPTQKLKRVAIQKRHAEMLAALYAQGKPK